MQPIFEQLIFSYCKGKVFDLISDGAAAAHFCKATHHDGSTIYVVRDNRLTEIADKKCTTNIYSSHTASYL